jgi:phosphatidylglycerophosphatase C
MDVLPLESSGTASSSTTPAPLAVFDLDGTLVAGDTLLPFLVSYGLRRRPWPLVTLPFPLGLYACGALSAASAKEQLLVSFLRGQGVDAVAEHAEWFSAGWVRRRLRPTVLSRLRGHQAAGHRVVLLSASPDVYVPTIARSLGIDEVVCTRVANDGVVWEGTLVEGNCKGDAKLAQLRRYLGCESWSAHTYAYGDRPEDLPVLRWAEEGYLVTSGLALERA